LQPTATQLRWAIDPEFMRGMLETPIREVYQAQISEVRLSHIEYNGLDHVIHYDFTGQRRNRSWRQSLIALARRFSESSPPRAFPPLSLLQDVWQSLHENPKAFLLPRPVARLSPLAMMFFEEATPGTPIASLLNGPQSLEVASLLGEAMAALNQAPIDSAQLPASAGQAASIRGQVDRFAEGHPNLASRAKDLLQEIESRTNELPVRVCPCLGWIPLRMITRLEDRIALTQITGMQFANQLMDIGELLCQIALLAPGDKKIQQVVEQIRKSYLRATGGSEAELLAFEAAAFLRQATGPQNSSLPPEKLLDYSAERLLLAASTEAKS
ncbi:MAG: hypothetical protein ACE5Q6_26020, partial [Dehalococcoidia bacterium]